MSSNDVSQQSQSASRSSFKTAYIPNSANSYNLELKTVQNAFSVLHGVLDIFSDIETDSNSKNLMRGMSETAFFEKTMKSPKKNGGIEIGEKEKILAYFQLSTSSDEFQNIINKFQQDFCTGRDSTMTEADFKRMLNFLGKKENIGRTKMEKLFKKLVTQTFETCDRLDRSLGSKDENELGGYLANGVFQLLKHEVTVLSQESRVDNLKLLPLLIGFHSRLLEARISKKAEILENIIGLNSKGKRIKSSEVNLYEKFESLGKKIEKKASISLSYKDVEKALSLFISSSPESLSPQQKDLVLQDLQGKYKYSKKNEEFARSPVYNLKFLTYLASRICVRGIKATEQQALLEEYTEWNIVLHAEKLDSEKLGKKFLKYAGKRTDIEKPVSLKSLDNLFSSFIAKVIPTIHKKVTESVLMEYLEKAEDKQEFKLLDFSEKISRLLFRQAEAKLETYIRFVYELTTPSHSPIYRSANSSKQVSFREYNQDSQTKGVQIVVTPSALETELANNEGLHHREVSFAIPVESDNDKSQSFEDSIQFTLKKELSINIPQQSADFISQPRPHSRTVSGSQTVKAEKKSVNRVFWSSTASPSKQLSEIEERKDESPHQEYLNSCFVKEALLNSSPSGRVTYPKGKKKRAPSRKLQFAKQNQDEEETMTEMTKETFSRAEVLSEFETSVKSPDAHNSVENSRIEVQTPGDSFPKFSEFMESYKRHKEEKSFQNLESGMAQLETDGKDDKDRSFCDMSKCNLM